MLYIYSILLTTLGLFKKNSRLIFLTTLALLIIIFAGNTDNGDRYLYLLNYNSLISPTYKGEFEVGYQMLARICVQLGLTYNQFLLIVVFIGLSLISSTIKMFTPKISYVIALYFIYPFLWDVVQIRNFLAMSIIIFGMRYIINNKKNYFKYVVCVLIATSVHTSSIFYLFILLIKVKNTKKLFIITLITTVSSIVFMPKILGILSIFVSVDKIEAYTQTKTSGITKSFVIFYYIYLIILVKYSVNLIKKYNCDDEKPINHTVKYKFGKFSINRRIRNIDENSVLKLVIISMLGIYFLLQNLNFIRIYRNLYIIYYILFSICLSKMKKDKKYYIYFISVLCFVILSFVFFISIIPTTKIVVPIFENNLLFSN